VKAVELAQCKRVVGHMDKGLQGCTDRQRRRVKRENTKKRESFFGSKFGRAARPSIVRSLHNNLLTLAGGAVCFDSLPLVCLRRHILPHSIHTHLDFAL
jgi:hypothetical protein